MEARNPLTKLAVFHDRTSKQKVLFVYKRVFTRAENGVTVTAVVTADQLSGDHW